MIKIQVIGHIGADAKKNEVNGKVVINFSVAHSEKYKTAQGEQKEKTTWVECAYWTEKTGILPYLLKGASVYVEGQPEVRTWESNGKSGASLICRVSNIQLLGGKEQQPQAQSSAVWNGVKENVMEGPAISDEPVDDLPF